MHRAVPVLLASLALAACHYRKSHPVPGPRSGAPHVAHAPRVSEIRWFQGSLDEAFARPAGGSPPDCLQRYNRPRLGL
ncbi:MAG: hypothetical protein JOZ03_10520 [Gammaproteobacteria bacterium]|nr:hypothetical protein [Gammaproteobacteria bacterium]